MSQPDYVGIYKHKEWDITIEHYDLEAVPVRIRIRRPGASEPEPDLFTGTDWGRVIEQACKRIDQLIEPQPRDDRC